MTEKVSKSKLVFSTTNKIIAYISNNLGLSKNKAVLAGLRNSIGKPLSQSMDSLQVVYENIPDELLNLNYEITREELAIITTLQIYAIHQQSKTTTVNFNDETKNWDNLGYSLSMLRSNGESLPLDRRFNALITSQDYEELTHHLRQIVKILKTNEKNIKINYPKLATDLYKFLNNNQDSVRLNWARAYYSNKGKGEKENE